MTDDDYAILAAAMDRILPSDDHDAGASAANAIEYACRIMRHESFQPQAHDMHSGLRLLQSMARGLFGTDFCACDAGQRDRILETVATVPHPTIERFFLMLVRMTLAGFLCEPRHGGNRDGVGWRFLGYRAHPRRQHN